MEKAEISSSLYDTVYKYSIITNDTVYKDRIIMSGLDELLEQIFELFFQNRIHHELRTPMGTNQVQK